MKTVGLIMAGGSGTRFWPLSRRNYPKQALKLIGDREMINITIERCAPFIKGSDMYIITNREQRDLLANIVGDRMPSGNIFAEPCGRNTAPCILYSALKLHKRYGDVVMCVLSADHYIKDEQAFRHTLEIGAKYARENDVIVTMGIVPTFPSTGYGYIKKGRLDDSGAGVYHVDQFVEKPDVETANEYINSGVYLWNSGMFIFKTSTILESFKCYLPKMYESMSALREVLDTHQEQSFLEWVYPTLDKISIDYGIMEQEKRVAVIPGDFGWSDIGSWDALEDVIPPDQDSNVVHGKHVGIETKGCVVYSEKQLIATIGLSDIVVVSVGDSVLVCTKDKVQDIKQLVDKLEKKGHNDLL